MAVPQHRVFFDTSVYISALLSEQGAARELIRLAESGAIRMVVSEEVIVEVDRVLSRKFPVRVEQNRQLWKHLDPEMVPNPTTDLIKPFSHKLARGAASIFCAAHLAKVSAFVAWNTRDFMAHGVHSLVDFPIVIPADALKLFRKWIEPFLD